MVEENSKCPACGEGSMKLVLDTTELTPQAIRTSLRARCTRCGHEDNVRANDPD